MPVTAAKKQSRKTSSTFQLRRPPLEPSRTYTVNEAALAMAVSTNTIWRAIYSDNLKHYRVGRRVLVDGQQLIDWRTDGGKTAK